MSSDTAERSVLFLDTLRERGNEQVDMSSRPLATVLTFGHKILLSGEGLRRPINYSLGLAKDGPNAIIAKEVPLWHKLFGSQAQAAAFQLGSARNQDNDSAAPIHNKGVMTDDDIIQLIDNFAFDAGPVVAQRRNRGFTLIRAETDVPIARLRPLGRDDLHEILNRSLGNERWAPFGPFGRTALPAEQAVRVVPEASILWATV